MKHIKLGPKLELVVSTQDVLCVRIVSVWLATFARSEHNFSDTMSSSAAADSAPLQDVGHTTVNEEVLGLMTMCCCVALNC